MANGEKGALIYQGLLSGGPYGAIAAALDTSFSGDKIAPQVTQTVAAENATGELLPEIGGVTPAPVQSQPATFGGVPDVYLFVAAGALLLLLVLL